MEYDGSLEALFTILEEVCNGKELPSYIQKRIDEASPKRLSSQHDLFDERKSVGTQRKNLAGDHVSGIAKELYEVSAIGYSNFVYAWMSEFPIEAEIIQFGFSLIQAARNIDKKLPEGMVSCEGRDAAEIARNDRMNPAVKIVRDASCKAGHEAHRLSGLLRFSLGNAGIPVAFCAPDHFVLPILAEHFTLRFGDSPWAIIDEKRQLALIKNIDDEAQLEVFNPDHPWFAGINNGKSDEWESLWLSYFTAINNKSRANPKAQLQFMPKRYWKYLPEMRDS